MKMRNKPMLAYPVSAKPIDYTNKVYIQPKLDGVRCLIQYDKGKVTAYSRTGKVWKNIDHILNNLEPWFENNQLVVLDGELYNHDLRNDFEQIISIVRRQTPDDLDMLNSAEIVQFHCYDIIHPDNDYFDVRNNFIKFCLPESYCVKHVETTQTDEKQAHFIHTQNLRRGYEGSIVRLNTPYQQKRSHSLRKFKDFSDAEANIVGYEEGKGKRAGTLGKFLMQDDDGNQFGCPPGKGHNYKDLALMLQNVHEYMGQRATFTFFERTKAGSYRHPLFKCIRNYE